VSEVSQSRIYAMSDLDNRRQAQELAITAMTEDARIKDQHDPSGID
jgi:hypothetical protein